MSDKKSNYFQDNTNSNLNKRTSDIYRYSGSHTNIRQPQINTVYNDAVIYRKENYGVFVNFDNNNFNALLHKSKMCRESLNNFKVGDKISVSVIEIKERGKISVKLFHEDFPSLVTNNNNNNKNYSSRWGNNLEKVVQPVKEKMRKRDLNEGVRCKYSGKYLSLNEAYKCKESINGDVYYFESLDNIIRYNKENNRYLKLLSKTGELERVEGIPTRKNDIDDINDIDIL